MLWALPYGVSLLALGLMSLVLVALRRKAKTCFFFSSLFLMSGAVMMMTIVSAHTDPAYFYKRGSKDYWGNLAMGCIYVAVGIWGFWNFHRGGQEIEAERLANLGKQPRNTGWPDPTRH